MKLKTLSLVGLSAVLSITSIIMAIMPVRAAGSSTSKLSITASSSSAPANGSSAITFSVYSFSYWCDDISDTSDTATCPNGSPASIKTKAGKPISIYTESTGNIFGQTATGSDGAPVVYTADNGRASFTVASTTAGSKSFRAYFVGWDSPTCASCWPAATVTYTVPASATPQPKPSTSTPPAATPAPVAAPETPKVATLEVAGKEVKASDPIVLDHDKPLVLSGTTIPNGVVKLYIFSTPREATVTADASGKWTYTVKGLETGSHHVEAEVTDPATQKTSSRATVATFKIRAAASTPIQANSKEDKKNTTPWLWIIGGIIILLLASGAGIWWYLRRHKKPASAPFDNDKKVTDTTSDQDSITPPPASV